MAKVSVIIPVYNVEKYLRQCLDSVVNQTLKDIEIICINDGSTDSSYEILQEYAQKHNNIIIIKNDVNKGQGYCKNIALQHVTGDYISFIDSDDFVSQNFLEEMLTSSLNNDSDIVMCKFVYEDKKSHTFKCDLLKEKIYYKFFDKLSVINNGSCCDKFFKSEIIKKYNITFPESIYYEDNEFLLKNVYYSNKLYVTNKCSYYYRYNPLSTTNKIDNSQILKESASVLLKNIMAFFDDKHITPKEYEKIVYFCIKSFCMKYIINDTEFKLPPQIDRHKAIRLVTLPRYKNIFQKIFSLKNTQPDMKVMTIFGFPIFLKRSRSAFKIEKGFVTKINKNIRPKSVLLIELNDFHREIMPGYAKYFQELGYNVDILTTMRKDTEDCFCKTNADVNKYYTTPATIINFLTKTKEYKKYNYIFFNSYSIYRKDFSNIDLYKILKIEKDNIPRNWIFVAHTTEGVDTEFLLHNKSTALASTILQLPIINPHYFGNVDITEKNTQKTIFLAAGDNKKGFESIVLAVEKLLESNITNFEIYITGRFKHKELKNKYKKHIKFLGYVNFKTLYSIVEKSDFIITNLNPENTDHDWYIKYGTSGAFQLCYGFLKPMIIPEKFAQKACVNTKNSIIYTNNDNLHDALKSAIKMDYEKYKNMQEELRIVEKELYNLSLDNLKKLL